jgi:hypothetical protein
MSGVLAELEHPKWGRCELVRVEGTDWVVRLASNGTLYRFPPSTRSQFTHVAGHVVRESGAARGRDQFPAEQPAGGKASLAVIEHAFLGDRRLDRPIPQYGQDLQVSALRPGQAQGRRGSHAAEDVQRESDRHADGRDSPRSRHGSAAIPLAARVAADAADQVAGP